MSLDELLLRLNAAEAMKYGGRGPYLVSYAVYQATEQAIDHYLASGELVEGPFGLERAPPPRGIDVTDSR